MTKQDLLNTKWRVYLNYGGPVPLPDHAGQLVTRIQDDLATVVDANGNSMNPAPTPPISSELFDRIYFVSSSLPADPKQNLVVGWKEVSPFFTLTTEEAA